MLIGVIADDFTGAGDIANTLAKGLPEGGGLAVTQYLGIPSRRAEESVEAGVVSLKTRSIAPQEAVAQSLAALDWLKAQGCRQIVFKYCSTFDSTPEGNIGPVAEALANALGVRGVVACPAFPTLGRTIHQGHLFVQDRLLSESSMRDHPLTPMTDPDIRRWLGRQCAAPVGLVAAPIVRKGSEAVAGALVAAAARGETLVIADAATDEDLLTLGRALAGAPLVTGGSGIALGLPRNFIEQGLAHGGQSRFVGVRGPQAILAGSCSSATRGQIATHSADHPSLALDVDAVMAGETSVAQIVDFIARHANRSPLVYSSSDPAIVAAAQERYGRERLARHLDDFFAQTARDVVRGGVRRLVVAGGETSGAVAQAVGLDALAVGPEIEPGVPVLSAPDGSLAMALKSGNFGGPDFFRTALDALAGEERS